MRPSLLLIFVAGVLPGYVVAADRGATVTPAESPSAALTSGRSCSTDWPKYCGGLEMTGRASCEAKISAATAGRLALIWAKQLGGTVASAPSVVASTVYVGDWSGTEWALDVDSGVETASVNLGTTHAAQCNPPDLGITSSPLVSGDRLFLAGGDGSFYCLDAGTLAVLWQLTLGDNSPTGGYYGWCSPSLAAGELLQGVSSNCDNPFVPGKIVAIDPATGSLLGEGDFAGPGQVGGGEWTSPAVDVESNAVYVSTASALDYAVDHAYSIVRLSLPDLAIEDSWKLDPVLVDDADWGSSPTLFEDGSTIPLVGAGEKDGGYYAFARNNLSAGPLWRAAIAVGGDCPQCAMGTLSTAAFDGAKLYVGGGTPPGNPPAGVRGSVAALDPGTGQILWRYAGFPGPVIAPASVANGVVFAVGGNLAVGLDAGTGAVLWSFTTAVDCYGGIAVSDGKLFFGDLGGNFYAFALAP